MSKGAQSAGYGDTSYFTLPPQSHGAVWKRNNCEEPDVLVYTHGDFRTMFKLNFTYESNNCDYVPGYSSGLGTSAGSGAPIFAPDLQTIAALPPNRQQINIVNDTKYVFTVWVSKSMRSSCDGWRPGEPQPACPATGPDAPGYVYDPSGNDVSAPLGPGEKRSFDRTRWRNGAVYVRVSYMETHLLAPAYEALPPVAAGQTPTIPQWSGDGWYTTAISLEPDDVSQGWLHLKYDSDTSPDTPDISKFRHEYNSAP